ncbi:uncharacterized protein RJT20DRAFT_30110 [Scheffersomyces xylosifermentans]|uniref:uncharacterized protein n=1 Tax=Scheffersomyces xylosifermentans TaxID=1304137 RepID=UPI00315DED95
MAPKINQEAVVPYRHSPSKPRGEASSMIAQSLPMAAMFMRNKMLSWSALFLAIQSYLNEPINKPVEKDDSGTPAQPPLLRVVFAFIALVTCYIDIIFPGSSPAANRVVKEATESVTSAVTSAVSAATSG